ncbi:MAG: wcoG [Pseudonocardiales bacterium]|nr:wcoG [Pseudonocardiales bacterium]
MALLCIGRATNVGRTVRLICAALSLSVVGFGIFPVLAASADTAPAAASGLPETVSADSLPTVQINGVVWSTVTVGNTVYAAGDFTKARPYGSAVGVNETNRGGILAFDITTGNLITSFNHTLNGAGRIIVASPDKTRVYVAGDFTTVDGIAHGHVAGFDVATGALVGAFSPTVSGTALGLAASNSTVYLGGSFTSANGQTNIKNVAAFSKVDGSLQTSWSPQMGDGTVTAMAMTPDQSAVVIGGRFTTVNGANRVGLTSVSATDGSNAPWNADIPIRNYGDAAAVTTLTTSNNQILLTGYVFGATGTFEGVAGISPTGNINFLNSCHGDTYGAFGVNGVVYSASHEHDCSDLGIWNDTTPRTWHRATASMDHSVNCTEQHNDDANYTDFYGQPCATQLDWYPDFAVGTYTGAAQGPWAVSGNANYIAYGGEFPSVNNGAQQGLTRFAVKTIAPNKQGPIAKAGLIPTAVSLKANTARVSWATTYDRDNQNLTYNLYRSGTTLPIYTVTQPSTFWNMPNIGYQDTGLVAGASYKYRITVSDPMGNTTSVAQGAAVTIAATTAASAYSSDVIADGASDYWRLGEASGTSAYDWINYDDLALKPTVTQGDAGAIAGDTNTATTFDGAAAFGVNATAQAGPNVFTEEVWFKTTTTAGGKIIGFGNANTGNSSNYDRHIYMSTNGSVYFGVYNNGSYTINTAPGLNDGQWHQAVGTMSSTGMTFYVDGKKVGANANNAGQSYSGYWRVGGDTSWSGNAYFAGSIDEAAIYPTALTKAQVQKHYLDSGRALPAGSTSPSDAYGAAVYADSPSIYYRMDDAAGTVATDLSGNGNNGVYSPSETFGAGSAVTGATGSAVTFDGSQGTLATGSKFANPTTYSEELWFKTTTTSGGKLIGFGGNQTTPSSNHDRDVYMGTNGLLTFGTWIGSTSTVTSTAAYNDGTWHHVVATQGANGMKLYVDAQLVASNTNTSAENNSEYWRIGGDTAWNSTYGFAGTIDEVAIYSSVLTPAQISAHFAAASVVNTPPTASFTKTPTNLDASFDASGSSDVNGTIAGYAWNFGDGTTGTGSTPSHSYPAAGTYTVTLVVTDNAGATSTSVQTVVVTAANVAPTAAFIKSNVNLAASFDATGSTDVDGTIAGFAWNFGDGSTGTGSTPTHTYALAGTYPVTLVVTDNSGATATVTQSLVVVAANVAPTAAFASSAINLGASFDATGSFDSDGTIAGYAWDFGDGSTGTGSTPTHAYAAAGSYVVTLVVTDNSGATGTAAKTVAVTAPPLANQAPTAAFTNTVANLNVSFSAAGSTDADGTIAGYAWNFGDGSTGTGVTTTHVYAAAGSYTVTLVATDNVGATGTAVSTVTPTAALPTTAFASDDFSRTSATGWGSADTGGVWTSSLASASAVTAGSGTLTLATAGVTRSAYLNSIASSDTDVHLTFALDKLPTGGGTYVTVAGRKVAGLGEYRAKVQLVAGGAVRIQLVRSNSANAETLIGSAVTVSGLTYTAGMVLQVRLQVFGTNPTTLNAKVWNNATAEPATWQVSASDNTDGLQTAGGIGVIGYASGSSTTMPQVISFDTLRATGSQAAAPNQLPVAAFTASVTGAGVTFNGAGSTDTDGTIAGYAWDFGDNTTGTGTNPSHVYATPGTHQVKLTVTDNQGATSSLTQPVVTAAAPVNQVPVAAFAATVNNLTVAFDGSGSTDADGAIASYAWNFGDGTTGAGISASHTYATAGTFTATLTVTDNQGATSPFAQGVSPVNAPVNQAPTALFTSSTLGLTVNVIGTGSTDSDGSIASYAWNFGDGVTGSGASTTHLYAAAGSYVVTLVATDNLGGTGTATGTVVVVGPTVLAADDFGRTAATGWGTADQGGLWTVSSSSIFSVAAGVGKLTLKAAGSGPYAFMNTVSSSDTDVQASFSLDSNPTGGGTYVSLAGRRITGAGDYRAKVLLAAGGAVRIALTRTDSTGAETIVVNFVTVAGLTYNAGDVLQVRMQAAGVNGTSLKAKVWKVGTIEPAAWAVSATDTTTALQAPGGVGVIGYLSGSSVNAPVVISVDGLRVYKASTV